MPRTGRPPVPTHLKILRGTRRKDRENTSEPKPASGEPSCPSWLGRLAKQEWRRVIPELREMGTLAKADRAIIAVYCQAYGRLQEFNKAIDDNGSTFVTEKGYVCQRPEVSMASKQMELVLRYSNVLGLNASARSGIKVQPPQKPTSDPIAEKLFGRRRSAG